jgi:2-oxoglutarate dehydrogenase E2 component (dihydrolipoamide succinyltransferase)
MKKEITVPKLGESITEGILSAWLKENGSIVEEGDEIYELESDKATMAIPAPFSGKLIIETAEGTDVEVGKVVGFIDTDVSAGTREQPLSPAVKRIVAEYKLDPEQIEGTGREGRILKEDVLRAAEKSSQPAGTAENKPSPVQAAVPPTQTGGQVQRRVKMSSIRKRIAQNLVSSKQGAAHLTTFNEINMEAVMNLRKKHQEAFTASHGVKLGFMSFFVRAACEALKKFPNANAFIEGEEIVYNDFYNVGIAVSTERGLVVPVLKNADLLSFDQIEMTIADFASRARDKKLTLDELTGGTFSITNGGVFGSLLSTPIPTPPQSAILGMHTIQKRPIAVGDEVKIKPMMYVAVTYDHRIMDGRDAVGTLKKIKELVEDPEKLLLNL